jgi:hypothetical protein
MNAHIVGRGWLLIEVQGCKVVQVCGCGMQGCEGTTWHMAWCLLSASGAPTL